ncbi:MAG TPA: HhH-GPD-type base excision DNA repair protein [Acidimicrobiales bacterium]|nr:HhH-GPD-type base excision DNA repair protein [Acidimicrobiales bacterium]
MTLHLAGEEAADRLLTEDPFALLIGMVLDQQIPLERAFAAPLLLRERLGGSLDVQEIASMDPKALADIFSAKPALHRFPAAMANRVQILAALLIENFGGESNRIWTDAPDGAELLRNVKALPGFGEQKARIFIGLLGKQLGVRPDGWERAAGNFGTPGTFASIADIDGPEALRRVREHKAQMKAAAKAAKGLGTAGRPTRRPAPR